MQGHELPPTGPPQPPAASEHLASAARPTVQCATQRPAEPALPPMSASELAHYRAIFLAAEGERGAGVTRETGVRVFKQVRLRC